jgi:hypothetical protein
VQDSCDTGSKQQKSLDEKRLQRTPDSIEFLWRYYEEHAAQARQHETLRASVASILGGIGAAVVALAGTDGMTRTDAFAGVVVIALGILGAALSIKHYERNRMHTRIMGEIRDEISALQQKPELGPRRTGAIRAAAEKYHNKTFTLFERRSDCGRKSEENTVARSRWVRLRLHTLWLLLNLFVALVGVLLVIASRFWR